ncbi:hypothetical protein OTU49_004152, partial [Cherax quadricarinatus]
SYPSIFVVCWWLVLCCVLLGCPGAQVNLTCPAHSFFFFGAQHQPTEWVTLTCSLGYWTLTWPKVNQSEHLLNGCYQESNCSWEYTWKQKVNMTLGAEVELWLRSPDDYNITRLLGVSNLSLNGTIIVEGTTNQTMNMTCSDPTALFWLPSSTASVIAFTCQAYGYWMHSRGLCFQACKTKMRNVVCRFPFLYEGQEYSRCTAVSRRADQAGDDLVCGIVYNVTQNWQLKACDMDNTS